MRLGGDRNIFQERSGRLGDEELKKRRRGGPVKE
jgi:hypothetical protein